MKALINLLRVFYCALKVQILVKTKGINYFGNMKISDDLCILMNGPTLEFDLERLPLKPEQDVLVCNHFCDTELFSQIRPKFYLIQDHYFWSSQVSKNFRVKASRSLENLIEKVDWKMNVVLPISAFNTSFVKGLGTNPNIELWFYSDCYMPIQLAVKPEFCKFGKLYRALLNLRLSFIPPMNVFPTALFLGGLNGASRIFYYGVSFDWWKSFRIEGQHLVKETNYVHGKEVLTVHNDKLGRYPGTLSFKLMNFASTYQLIEAVSFFLYESGVQVIDATEGACVQMYKGNSVEN